jgi:endonuclease/exonuclease/phosphatase family metal-dependent hydrolase
MKNKFAYHPASLKTILFFILFNIITIFSTEYKPADIEEALILNKNKQGIIDSSGLIKIFTWNIGIGSATKDKGVFSSNNIDTTDSLEKNKKNIENIILQKNYDLIMLQEAPLDFARYFTEKQINSYNSYYAYNIKESLFPGRGNISIGLTTLTQYQPIMAKRIKLPGLLPWPVNLFTYKRCLLETRYPYKNKELVVYNVHIEFFDNQEKVRTQELNFIKEKILEEYTKGNYVIAGGDWNLVLPGVNRKAFSPYQSPEFIAQAIKKFHPDWTPKGWDWVYPLDIPTIRSTDTAYKKGKNYTTVIDGFIISPNIAIISSNGVDLGFEYSDHQPVDIEIKLDNP